VAHSVLEARGFLSNSSRREWAPLDYGAGTITLKCEQRQATGKFKMFLKCPRGIERPAGVFSMQCPRGIFPSSSRSRGRTPCALGGFAPASSIYSR
jgi:hypothetical protein